MDTTEAPSADDELAEPTVRSRMLAAGISPDEITACFEAGRIRLNGEVITALDQPAPHGSTSVSIGLP